MGMESSTLGALALGTQAVGTVVGATAATKNAKRAAVDKANAATFQQETRDFTIATGVQNAEGRAQVYEYQAAVARNNEQLELWRAQDATTRGQVDAARVGLSVRQLEGRQRASAAARGLDLNEGSPLLMLADTHYMGDVDMATVASNTEKEAFGYRIAAQNAANDAGLLKLGASNARAEAERLSGAPRVIGGGGSENPALVGLGTLLTGAGTVAKNWYDISRRG